MEIPEQEVLADQGLLIEEEVSEDILAALNALSTLSTFSEYNKLLANYIFLQEGGIPAYIGRFNALGTNAMRANYIYEHLKEYELLGINFTPESKSDWKAKRHIRKGRNNFMRHDAHRALGHWTRAIYKAHTSIILAESYACRSAALFKMGLYRECVEDVDRALGEDYPEEKKGSLEVRRKAAVKRLENCEELNYYEPTPTIHDHQRNRHIAGATNSIEIRTRRGRRRVFAIKDIKVGEVIAVERAWAWMVATMHQFHCAHCFHLCYNLIPCKYCCQVGYCKERCRDEARREYHEFECPILISLKNLVGGHRGIILALKMTFLRMREDEQGAAAASDIHRLIEGMDQNKLEEDIYVSSLVTALIFNMLEEHTTYFEQNRDIGDDFKELFLTHIQLIQLYGASIDELGPNPHYNPANPNEAELMAFNTESVGCGLFTLYSLISHSCGPNIFLAHHGVFRVLRASRTIKAGQELVASYGPCYVKNPKDERQHRCRSQYLFTCTCRPCKEDWPTLDDQPYLVKIQKHVALLGQIRSGNTDTPPAAIPEFVTMIRRFETFEPNSDLILYQKLLAHCYDIQGNKRRI